MHNSHCHLSLLRRLVIFEPRRLNAEFFRMTDSSIAVPDAAASPDWSAARAADWPRPTTIVEAPRLAAHLGVEMFLATETFQRTGSFKFRAAFSVAANVPHPHVITASSGNFGQAMAYACKLFGKRCTIVMPANSARVKIDAVLSHGGRVDLVDTTKVQRAARVAQLAAENPDAYVASAYDDPLVIAGNSSLGDELVRLATPPDVVVVAVGGGGLSSGLIQAARRADHQMAVVGSEPLIANDAARSLRAGHIVVNDAEPQTIADGTRTLSVGKHNWEILKDGLETIVEVPEDAIREGVRLLFSLANLKAEPTGALGVAALITSPETFRGRRVCCVVTGGNVDPAVYASLIG
jgi:threonine dehydratase